MARARPSVPVVSAHTTCIHSNARASHLAASLALQHLPLHHTIDARLCPVGRCSGGIERAHEGSRAHSESHSRIACTSVQWSIALHSVAAIGQLDTALCVLPCSQSRRKWLCRPRGRRAEFRREQNGMRLLLGANRVQPTHRVQTGVDDVTGLSIDSLMRSAHAKWAVLLSCSVPVCGGAIGAAREETMQPHAVQWLCFRCSPSGHRQRRRGLQLDQL